jgi:hypothetical protein
MGDLRVQRLFAIGHSQSASRLGTYVNGVHPLGGVFDAVILHGGGGRVRPDPSIPVWKLLAETDVQYQAAIRQADTDRLRTWEVAGTSHADFRMISYGDRLAVRDGPMPPLPGCQKPPYSRIPFNYVLHAALDHLTAWVKDGHPPPSAPPIEIAAAVGPPAVLARDGMGNVLGGIALSQHAVPTAVNTGVNAGPVICPLSGSHEPLDAATLAKLYPTHSDYLARVREVTRRNLNAGYVSKADAEATIAEAEGRSISK